MARGVCFSQRLCDGDVQAVRPHIERWADVRGFAGAVRVCRRSLSSMCISQFTQCASHCIHLDHSLDSLDAPACSHRSQQNQCDSPTHAAKYTLTAVSRISAIAKQTLQNTHPSSFYLRADALEMA